MDAQAIIDKVRRDLDDTDTVDPLWTTEELVDYINEAVLEFCERTKCNPDFESAFTTLSVTADNPWVPFDEKIVRFARVAYRESDNKRISITSVLSQDKGTNTILYNDYGQFSATPPNWLEQTGQLQKLFTDMARAKLRAFPIPTADDTVRVLVHRTAAAEIVVGALTAIPDIPERFHRLLIASIKMQAYLKEDAETYSRDQAAYWENKWERNILDAKWRIRELRGTRPRLVRYSGI